MNNRGTTNVPGQEQGQGNLYARQQGSQHAGTVVPGMNQQAPAVEAAMPQPEQQQQRIQPTIPVVGFLYSISRQGFGEYWPLHVGTNTIGRGENNDIRLMERTVSERHANLFIRQMKSSRKIIASIRDEGSKNGIFVNDEELTYDAHECHNRDIITVGNNYRLLLILIDADEMGLSVAQNFQPLDNSEPINMPASQPMQQPYPPMGQPQAPQIPPIPMGQPIQQGTMPAQGNSSLYDASKRAKNGTVSMDGSVEMPGGNTQFLQ